MKNIPISKISLTERNPRKISKNKLEQLKKSIAGFTKMMEMRPLVVDEDYNLLGGNQRLTALIELGYVEIPSNWVIVQKGLTDEEKKEFIIRDNTHYGEWDFDILESDWNSFDLNDFGIDFKSSKSDKDPFDDDGISANDQYGVIIMCDDAKAQEKVFSEMQKKGYKCKIVVT